MNSDEITVPVTDLAATDLDKPFRFEGSQFRRWKQKLHFFLTTKKVAHVLNENVPVVDSKAEKEVQNKTNKEILLWNENDYLCKGYILNRLSDQLYDYYSNLQSAKDVWDALEKKYDTEEAGAKKYAVSRYLNFKMRDDKTVEVQSHELQKIAHEITSEGITLDEKFQVAVIIDKLPPSWKKFKNSLMHKTKELSLEQLITRLRIEEEARKQDQKEEVLIASSKKTTGAVLKPTGKPFKNQNRNRQTKGYPLLLRGENVGTLHLTHARTAAAGRAGLGPGPGV